MIIKRYKKKLSLLRNRRALGLRFFMNNFIHDILNEVIFSIKIMSNGEMFGKTPEDKVKFGVDFEKERRLMDALASQRKTEKLLLARMKAENTKILDDFSDGYDMRFTKQALKSQNEILGEFQMDVNTGNLHGIEELENQILGYVTKITGDQMIGLIELDLKMPELLDEDAIAQDPSVIETELLMKQWPIYADENVLYGAIQEVLNEQDTSSSDEGKVELMSLTYYLEIMSNWGKYSENIKTRGVNLDISLIPSAVDLQGSILRLEEVIAYKEEELQNLRYDIEFCKANEIPLKNLPKEYALTVKNLDRLRMLKNLAEFTLDTFYKDE